MKSIMITGLAAISLLAISCKKESGPVTDKSSAPALATGINEAVNFASKNIHGQRWMITNLSVTRYRNGARIPQITDAKMWAHSTTGAWCWYNNDSANFAVYGRLYNWYAVNDPRGLAPAGWHIPSAAEWDTLSARLGGDASAGGKLKDTTHWSPPNTGATNRSGFTGLPGGIRFTFKIRQDYSSRFNSASIRGYWWSSTEYGIDSAWYRELIVQSPKFWTGANPKQYGLSVRCIKDTI